MAMATEAVNGAIGELLAAVIALPDPERTDAADLKAARREARRARKAVVDGKLRAGDLLLVTAALPLVGVKAGSKILGVPPPNFRRYKDRLTRIPVEGSADVFIRAEVEALRAQLDAERARRAEGSGVE